MTGRVVAAIGGAVLFAAAPLAAQSTAQQSVTLQEALSRAGVVTPAVLSARGSIRSSELAVRTARWAFIPNLTIGPQASLNLSSGQSRLDPVTGEVISGNTTNPSYGLNVRGSLNLFDGFARNHNPRAANARLSASEAQLLATEFNTALSTTNTFFDALSNQQRVRVSDAAVERA